MVVLEVVVVVRGGAVAAEVMTVRDVMSEGNCALAAQMSLQLSWLDCVHRECWSSSDSDMSEGLGVPRAHRSLFGVEFGLSVDG